MSVIIVGGGPVGLTASVALSRLGVPNVVVERDVSVYGLPRAIVMDAEVRHTLARLGIGPRLDEILQPMVAADFVDSTGTRLMGIEMQDIELFGCPVVSKHFQPMLDACLREAAMANGADLMLGRGVTSLNLGNEEVGVVLDDGSSLEGSHLIGCDGASSLVRKATGIALHDLGFDQDWLVVDLELADRSSSNLPDVTRQVCDAQRPTTLVSGFQNYYRFEFQLQPGEEPASMTSDDGIWTLLRPWISQSQARMVRKATYRFHAVVAESMNSGRVLIAGDAAHQMPPFMGQGLNCGMRDAFNLAWKVAYVERGWCDARLLDTYSTERIPLARHVVEQSVETGRLIDQLAGRVSHGVSNEAGYGGTRRAGRYERGVVVGDDPAIGAVYPNWHRASTDWSDAFLLLTGVPTTSADLGPVPLVEVVVDESARLGHDCLVIRPDGYVAAACRLADLHSTFTELRQRLAVASTVA